MEKEYDRERARSVLHKMSQTDRMHRSVIENFVSTLGIHRSQHMMLMYLAKTNGSKSQKQIAEEFDISPAAVAVTLKKLENAGFIEKNTSEGDNRFNEIKLTKKGIDLALQTRTMFDKVDYEMFADFTDEEYELLTKCFEKMQNGLGKLGAKNDKCHCKG